MQSYGDFLILQNFVVKNAIDGSIFCPAESFSEHLDDAAQSCYERIDLLSRVVEGERRAHGAEYAEAVHEGLGAMVACAHGNAQLVEERAEVGMVDIGDVEGDDSVSLQTFAVAIDVHSFDLTKLLQGVVGEIVLIRLNVLHANG